MALNITKRTEFTYFTLSVFLSVMSCYFTKKKFSPFLSDSAAHCNKHNEDPARKTGLLPKVLRYF